MRVYQQTIGKIIEQMEGDKYVVAFNGVKRPASCYYKTPVPLTLDVGALVFVLDQIGSELLVSPIDHSIYT